MINVILCGGSGTRLWPISRTLMPKQFVKLFNNKSLFQLTVERNSKVCDYQFIVSNKEQYFLALKQLEENSKFLLEPIGRNTAPAITLACMDLDPNVIVFVTPSDHLIKNEESYKEVVLKAKELAKKDNLVTFGITPDTPETGYGYIQADGEDVKAFVEKPDLETAKRYVEDGNYLWNSGMFMFKAGVFLDELKKYSPKIYDACKVAYENKQIQDLTLKIEHSDMLAIPSDSIDYAVMEKSDKVKVVKSDIGWSDLGSFDSLSAELDGDKKIEIDAKENFVLSDKKVAIVGVDNLVVVDTSDALLIAKKGETQKVKQVVEVLKEEDEELLQTHTKVYRPWGSFEVLLSNDRYKIKRIIVQPGKRLSLQKHFHRNEHWIVVSGTATVTVGEKEFLVRPNESTYIKMGDVHRLENRGKIPVVMIEAQVGEYTGEDDIVRIDDDFQRN